MPNSQLVQIWFRICFKAGRCRYAPLPPHRCKSCKLVLSESQAACDGRSTVKKAVQRRCKSPLCTNPASLTCSTTMATIAAITTAAVSLRSPDRWRVNPQGTSGNPPQMVRSEAARNHPSLPPHRTQTHTDHQRLFLQVARPEFSW
jgi:hypothetical protein